MANDAIKVTKEVWSMNEKEKKKSTAPKKRGGRGCTECKKKANSEAVKITDEARREENITIGICPFFKQDRGNGRVSCEGANFRFPDKEARREYVYRFCADTDGYKTCPLQVVLDHHYERKYASHE